MLCKAILKFEYEILQTWLITAKTPPSVNFMKTNLLIHTCGIFTHLWNPVVRLFTLLISFILKDQVSIIWKQSLLSHYPLWHAYLNIWWRLKISHIIIVFTCFVMRHRSKEKKLPQLFYCFHSELICFIAWIGTIILNLSLMMKILMVCYMENQYLGYNLNWIKYNNNVLL